MRPEHALQDLVDALSAELDRPVLLDDATLRPVAYTRQWGTIDAVRSESILSRGASQAVRQALFGQGIASARGVVRTQRVPELDMEERLCAPARHAGEVRGYLWLLDQDAALDEVAVARVEAAAARAAEMLALHAPPRSSLRDEGELLRALCSGRADVRAEAVEHVRTRRLLPDGPAVVLLIGARGGGPRPEWVLAALGARLSAGYAVAGASGDEVALVLSIGDPVVSALHAHEIPSRLHRALRGPQGDRPDVAIGQSGVARTLDGAADARRQAVIALRHARGRAAVDAAVAWDALGADRLVAQLDAAALDDVPPALVELIRSEPLLADTLAAYLDAAGDAQATAVALSLHRSGLYYRLRRIAELTGLDLRRGDDRLLAHLALRLRRLH
jgi:hypothetical protein